MLLKIKKTHTPTHIWQRNHKNQINRKVKIQILIKKLNIEKAIHTFQMQITLIDYVFKI